MRRSERHPAGLRPGSRAAQEFARATKLHPTGLHPASLAAQLLDFVHEHRLGLLGLAAAAEVVAADCRHNNWVADQKGQNHSDEWWLRMLDDGEATETRCRSAMAAFAADGLHDQLYSEMVAVASLLNKRDIPPKG